MIKSIIASIGTFICFPYFGQILANTPTISPANPTYTSNIKVFTKVITPNQGAVLYKNVNQDLTNKIINITFCYYEGMFTSPEFFYDTLTIGTLSSGNYQFNIKFYSSIEYTTCTNSDSTIYTYTVSVNPTSVQEHYLLSEIKIFPIPAVDKITLSSDNECKLKIFDQFGKLLFENNIPTFTQTINISSFPNGIYFITTENRNSRRTQKFIKN